MAQQLAEFTRSPAFTPIQQEIVTGLAARESKRTAWWQAGHDIRHRTAYEIFTLGY